MDCYNALILSDTKLNYVPEPKPWNDSERLGGQ